MKDTQRVITTGYWFPVDYWTGKSLIESALWRKNKYFYLAKQLNPLNASIRSIRSLSDLRFCYCDKRVEKCKIPLEKVPNPIVFREHVLGRIISCGEVSKLDFKAAGSSRDKPVANPAKSLCEVNRPRWSETLSRAMLKYLSV